MRRTLVALLLPALLLGLTSLPALAAVTGEGTFVDAGQMDRARGNHTATLLSDGRILVIGGGLSSGKASTELWDPSTGRLHASGSLDQRRAQHQATLLPSGEVLVTGGFADLEGPGRPLGSAELWDPLTGEFSPAGTSDVLGLHTATPLPDGSVLLIGNDPSDQTITQSWDPGDREFGPATRLGESRWGHSASPLTDGRVLVVGGGWDPTLATATILDPDTSAATPGGSMSGPLVLHQAVSLSDGRVLVVGGLDTCCTSAQADLWDPESGAFEAVGQMTEARTEHTATLLPDGRVLVVGGSGSETSSLASAEVWHPASASFSDAVRLKQGRRGHTATLLGDGRVLILGGIAERGSGDATRARQLSSAELYEPGP